MFQNLFSRTGFLGQYRTNPDLGMWGKRKRDKPRLFRSKSTYICRVQSCALRLPKYWPPTPLSTQRVCPPPHQRRGVHTRRPVRGWGSIFWKTSDIGLASYSMISLRFRYCQDLTVQWEKERTQENDSDRCPSLFRLGPPVVTIQGGRVGRQNFWMWGNSGKGASTKRSLLRTFLQPLYVLSLV